jgi:hypothetical protein
MILVAKNFKSINAMYFSVFGNIVKMWKICENFHNFQNFCGKFF